MSIRERLEVLETIPVWSDDPQELCAGRDVFHLGKNASYEAARRGEIPTLRFGKKMVSPVRQLIRVLEGA